MNNHVPSLSSQAAMVGDEHESMLPPYAPLVMQKQILADDTSVFDFAAAMLVALLSMVKPSFRSAN